MTLLQALPRNDEGYIVLKDAVVIVRKNEQGEDEESRTDAYAEEETVISMFGDYVNEKTPLSQETFDALLANSSDRWKEQWQRWRNEGLI